MIQYIPIQYHKPIQADCDRLEENLLHWITRAWRCQYQVEPGGGGSCAEKFEAEDTDDPKSSANGHTKLDMFSVYRCLPIILWGM